ncbi:flavin reductase family protein [Stutzerimonas stutzeri]|uniref:flavin reductase family protein n=1 Tax=Stutzerimonas stutzeri TaxID=316 RepID=UPI003EE3C170
MTLPIAKQGFPVHQVRRYLEPGPIVLITSCHAGQRNVMTLGWQTVMEFSPSLVGCMISAGNHSFELVRQSGECVINLPTLPLLDTVVKIGNCSGAEVDKFEAFGLATAKAERVAAPLLEQCHASFECRLYNDVLVEQYNFFIFEVVKAKVAPEPAHPETLHYTGNGVFVVAGGRVVDRRELFRPDLLDD